MERLRCVASDLGGTVAQVAIAWVLAQGFDIVPLVGARRRDRLGEALGALDLALSSADLAALTEAIPAGAAAGAKETPPPKPPEDARAPHGIVCRAQK